jgi:hypothetical protein
MPSSKRSAPSIPIFLLKLRRKGNPDHAAELLVHRRSECPYRSALANWAELRNDGFAIDSSGGSRLPNGARRFPDASWLSRERIAVVRSKGKGRSWGLCPEFVIERSETDRLPVLRRKMREWVDNGANSDGLSNPNAVPSRFTGQAARLKFTAVSRA